ncbi:hypothetical protein [Vagococcus bubulae]|uniref:hypothetical protein n=1 Tax=Vagococcus bubulae TaxID=1977868 RepID=UPI0022E15924|nr:hypothetical protein [Vagococcus bubulae]
MTKKKVMVKKSNNNNIIVSMVLVILIIVMAVMFVVRGKGQSVLATNKSSDNKIEVKSNAVSTGIVKEKNRVVKKV